MLSTGSRKYNVSILENDEHSLNRCLYSFSVSETGNLDMKRHCLRVRLMQASMNHLRYNWTELRAGIVAQRRTLHNPSSRITAACGCLL